MATLTSQQLKDSYQSLVTIGDSITSNPTSGLLENGLGNTLSSITIKGVDPVYKVDGDATSGTARIDFFDESVQKAFLGITTTSNWGGLANDVEGDLFLATHGTNNPSANVTLAPAQSVALRAKSGGDIAFLDTSSNEAFYWDASEAKLGIGTTSPDAKLEVIGNIKLGQNSSATESYDLIFRNAGSNGVTDQGRIIWRGTDTVLSRDTAHIGTTNIQTFGRGDLFFSTKGTADDAQPTERMRIDSSGNVGIGGSPSDGYRLQLLGDSEAGNTLGMTYVGVGASAIKVNSSGALEFGVDASDGSTERLRIDSSGNVGIGTTSPTSISGYTGATLDNSTNGGFIDLQSNGVTAFRFLTNGSVNNIETRTATPIVFLTNTEERMRILPTGGLTFNGDTATANALDDYEEGTFTPKFVSSTDSDDNVTNSRVGYYTKIGNMVYITVNLINNDLSGITGTDQVILDDLPFTASSTISGNDQAVTIGQYRYLATTDHTAIVQNNTDQIGFTTDGFVAATYTSLFSIPSNTGTSIKISAVYQTA